MLAPLLIQVSAHAASSREAVVDRHLRNSEFDMAQKKCLRWSADHDDADPQLRESCASAFWAQAEALDEVDVWRAYIETWDGTEQVKEAREREAEAELRLIGDNSTEDLYGQFLGQYPNTRAAKTARILQAEAAVRNCQSETDAIRIARVYPWHEGSSILLERFLAGFIHVNFNGGLVTMKVEPPVPLPKGKMLSTDWSAQRPDGRIIPWSIEARRLLLEVGFPQQALDRIERSGVESTPFPRCYHHVGQPWEIGVQVRLGTSSAFYPGPWGEGCGPNAWPMFLTVDDGVVSGIAVRPGFSINLPRRAERGLIVWNPGDGRPLDMVVPTSPGPPIVVGPVVGQRMPGLMLIHPLTGGMPWLFPESDPPEWAIPLTPQIQGAAVPPGWVLARKGEVTQAEKGGAIWNLPSGEVRVLSPLMQAALGLDRSNLAMRDQRASPLPRAASPSWTPGKGRLKARGPVGSQPVGMVIAPDGHRQRIVDFVARGDMPLRISKAWVVQMDEDSPDEILFEGSIERRKVKGLFDTLGSGRERLFLYRFGHPDSEFVAFSLDGFTYATWIGVAGQASFVEALHLDSTGLVREYSEVYD